MQNVENLCFPLETAVENIESDPVYSQSKNLIEPFREIIRKLRAGEELRDAVPEAVRPQVIIEYEARVGVCKEILHYEDDPLTASDYRNEIAEMLDAVRELS